MGIAIDDLGAISDYPSNEESDRRTPYNIHVPILDSGLHSDPDFYMVTVLHG